MDTFIELNIDVQRNPLVTTPITVNARWIVKITPRETVDPDGGAKVTLSYPTEMLNVVESYATLKKKLQV